MQYHLLPKFHDECCKTSATTVGIGLKRSRKILSQLNLLDEEVNDEEVIIADRDEKNNKMKMSRLKNSSDSKNDDTFWCHRRSCATGFAKAIGIEEIGIEEMKFTKQWV